LTPSQQYAPSPNLLVFMFVVRVGQPEPMKHNGAYPCQKHSWPDGSEYTRCFSAAQGKLWYLTITINKRSQCVRWIIIIRTYNYVKNLNQFVKKTHVFVQQKLNETAIMVTRIPNNTDWGEKNKFAYRSQRTVFRYLLI
jgi:hypothetical protein